MSMSEQTEPEIISKIRRIVAEHQYMDVAPGVPMDATTANAIITVYDKLSPEGQAKMAAMPPVKMAVVAWKLIGSHGKG